MKVAIITNSYPQGSETFIVRQATQLDAFVYCSSINENQKSNFNVDYSKVFSLDSDKKNFLSLFDKLYNKIAGRPFSYWSTRSKNKFNYFLRKHKIDVVIAQFGPNGIKALETCKKLSIPLVVQFLGYDASSLVRNEWYLRKINEVMSYASAGIVLYEGMEQPFITSASINQKFSVIS